MSDTDRQRAGEMQPASLQAQASKGETEQGLHSLPAAGDGAQGGVQGTLTGAVGGKAILLGIGVAVVLVVAAASVGLIPSPFSTTGNNHQQGASVATTGSSMFTHVPQAEVEKAIGLLMLAEPDKAKVRDGLERGTLRIALIIVADNDAEDGDWVSLTAAGFRQDVRLFHKPYTVAVPYIPGTPISVTGLKDGGGGDITVAVSVGAARLPLKPLKERETILLPAP